MADRIGVMDGGRLVQVGAPEDLYSIRQPLRRGLHGRGELPRRPRDITRPAGRNRNARRSAPRSRRRAAGGRDVLCCIRPSKFRSGRAAQRATARLSSPQVARRRGRPSSRDYRVADLPGETTQLVVLLDGQAGKGEEAARP